MTTLTPSLTPTWRYIGLNGTSLTPICLHIGE